MKKLSLSVLLIFFGLTILAEESKVDIDQGPSLLKAKVHATGHSFEAVVKNFNCELSVDSETGIPTQAKVSFKISDLGTDNDKRDKEMRHWLESDQFPEIAYTFESWKNEDHTVATGKMTIHGVEIPIETPVHCHKEGDRIVIAGTFSLNTTQFNLSVIKKMLFLKVDPLLEVEFHLEGTVGS